FQSPAQPEGESRGKAPSRLLRIRSVTQELMLLKLYGGQGPLVKKCRRGRSARARFSSLRYSSARSRLTRKEMARTVEPDGSAVTTESLAALPNFSVSQRAVSSARSLISSSTKISRRFLLRYSVPLTALSFSSPLLV